MPKTVGQYEKEDVIISNGRFGPYVRFGTMFVSLPKGTDPLAVELDDAIELIEKDGWLEKKGKRKAKGV